MRRQLFVALMLWSGIALAGTPLPDGPHVAVEGSATQEVAPDSVKVTLLFAHRTGTSLAAKQAVDEAVNRYLDALKQFAIAGRDIEAADMRVERVDDDDDEVRLRASRAPLFEAERKVTVVLDEIARLDALLDAGLRAGATQVDNVDFQLRDPAPIRREVKRKAVADAHDRANDIAQAAGASLGQVYSINSVRSSQFDRFGYQELDSVQVTGAKLRPAQYLSPHITISETVSLVYELRR
ncbi:SIMPL domain-containing protein [Stenotrophomonas sp. HITSZ_GD]|uniref:SIMPL domain-containing protein n=1 Tax=Stenotrophomonas sp. HITSZ_GD TaxID=3037248 RepID=UPI00240D24A5|nr:SIMPL domain-containing protein [Stenotrophomonas sp. HITSZ_GD]MDG2525387.1 SIMPL domain-containing protein [Stenotrophomonas sp. HITSZ_GD]